MATAKIHIASTEASDEAIEHQQKLLDTRQYSTNGILRYEFVFGCGFISSGGGKTTAEIMEKVKLPPGGKAIDVGCGIGGGTLTLANSFKAHVLGVDLSRNMISIAKKRYGMRSDVEFVEADVLRLNVPQDSCDLIYSRDTILHLTPEKKREFFVKSFIWLKPGAQLLVTDYCCGPREFWDREFEEYEKERNYHLISVGEYKNMLQETGFEVACAVDNSERWLQSLEEESNRLEKSKPRFLEHFTIEDFTELSRGWTSKKMWAAKGMQRWGLFIAYKPSTQNP